MLCGIPSEEPLALVAAALDGLGVPYVWFNQRRFSEMSLEWEIKSGSIAGRIEIDGAQHRLEEMTGVYLRLMDDTRLPELAKEPNGSLHRERCRWLHEALSTWCEVAPACIVNRISSQGSNSSKPFQMQLIATYGFSVPETLITNSPEMIRDFRACHGAVIFKSISGARSVVRLFNDADLDRLNAIRWCPVQFQAFVEGVNVRVQTVGQQVFACEIRTEATDYRYASRQGASVEIRSVTLASDVSERCVALAQGLGLEFAGLDLKLAPDGQVYCFEVNPSPAYSYFENHTGQPIAEALARHLAHLES